MLYSLRCVSEVSGFLTRSSLHLPFRMVRLAAAAAIQALPIPLRYGEVLRTRAYRAKY